VGAVHASRVLVVDDDAEVRKSLRRVFERRQYAVREAHDVESALHAAAAHHPDIVLLDLGLPGGVYDVVPKLREPPSGRRPFVCALAGPSEPDDADRARHAAFDAYILKSVDLDELVSLIRRVAGKFGGRSDDGRGER
jgi:two-component system KDP operon response regulator KdpE